MNFGRKTISSWVALVLGATGIVVSWYTIAADIRGLRYTYRSASPDLSIWTLSAREWAMIALLTVSVVLFSAGCALFFAARKDNTRQTDAKPGRIVNIRALVILAMLAAIATVLRQFGIPLPFFPSFLRLDFTDLPALIGSFMYGPVAGVFIQLTANLIRLPQTTTGGVGPLANFISGCALVVPAGLIYRYRRTHGGALLSMGAGIVSMAAVAAVTNYTLFIPFYLYVMGFPANAIIRASNDTVPFLNIENMRQVIIFTFIPFNIFKGLVVSVVTYFAYIRLEPIIRRQVGNAKNRSYRGGV
jgi:riboflavin transporter FmnP